MTDEQEGGWASPVQMREQRLLLQKITQALQAWNAGQRTDPWLHGMKVACVGAWFCCCFVSLCIAHNGVGFWVVWSLFLIQIFATLALSLSRRRHPIPRHWEDIIAGDLERYVPVNVNAFRWLQARVVDTGQITPALLAKWLGAESVSAGLVIPAKKSWAFTAREFPMHLAEEGRDERGKKP